MFNTAVLEDYPELVESDEWDEFLLPGESGEARRGRGRPGAGRVRTAKRGDPVPKAPSAGYASKAELQATANRLDGRIATNSKAIEGLDRRIRAIEADQAKMRVAVKREIADRKGLTDGLRRGLDESRQMAMLLPLLSTQETQTVGGVPNVVVDSGDTFSKILPILLLSGGLGGGASASGASGASYASGGGGGLFGGDNSIATLAIVMALTGGNR